MKLKELHNEYLEDSTLYCCYCGTEKYSLSCCGEVHYTTFADMSQEDQLNIINSDVRLQIVP
jgi:hypothetical protein